MGTVAAMLSARIIGSGDESSKRGTRCRSRDTRSLPPETHSKPFLAPCRNFPPTVRKPRITPLFSVSSFGRAFASCSYSTNQGEYRPSEDWYPKETGSVCSGPGFGGGISLLALRLPLASIH